MHFGGQSAVTLNQCGVGVVETDENGAEALLIYRAQHQPIDLAVIDLMMPDTSLPD